MLWYAIGVGVLVGVIGVATVTLSRRPLRPPAIDPFAVSEPWRQFVMGAQRSGTRLHATVDTAADGPLKARMLDIVDRFDHGLAEVWAIARRGDQIDDTIRRLDPTALRSREASLEARSSTGSNDDVDSALASVRSQIESTERLIAESARTADRLRLTQARLDELVARAAEVAIGAGDTDAYAHDVDDLVIELEALRRAVEEINRP